MCTVGRLNPFAPRPAQQIALPHQAQHLLVIDDQLLVLKLLGHAPVAVAGKLQTDCLYAVNNVALLPGGSRLTPVVIGAPGDTHQPASLSGYCRRGASSG